MRLSVMSFRGWLAAAALVVAAPAWGQIDHRVNQGNANSGGYALDRSNQVGSGGFNLSRPGLSSGAYSDALITRNVGGLAAFKGYSPIPQENAFRGELPSASLSDFQRRSVGPAELGSMSGYQPTFFYDQQRTIPTFDQIRNQQNLPGSSQLRSQVLPPINPAAQSGRAFTPNVRNPVDTRVGYNTPPAPIMGMNQKQTAKPVDGKAVGDIAPAYRAAMASPMFGVNLPSVTPAVGLQAAAQEGSLRIDGERSGLTANGGVGMGPGKPDDPFAPKPFGQPALDGAAKEKDDGTGLRPAAPSGEQLLPVDGRVPDNLGADRFADLYNAVRLAEQLGIRDLGFTSARKEPAAGEAAAGEGAGGEAAPADEPQGPGLRRKNTQGIEQLTGAAKWAGQLLEDPVTTFVGKYEDRLNQFMATGEQALYAGEYYRAARQFDLAHTIDPRNPLPLLQRGHALLAAGDYVSALMSLEQGIRLFPQIAAFRLDLPQLVGGRDSFDVRRADLESKLATKENYEFRFLLGYMELYSGLADVAMKNLEKAGAAAPPDSAIRQFVDSVLGRTPLPKLEQ